MPEPILVSWSGGKDSCMALHEILANGEYHVAGLLTAFNSDDNRVKAHGIPRELLEKQASSLGIPLHEIFVSNGGKNSEYEARIEEALDPFQHRGVKTVAFGDLFLEDIKDYRDNLMARIGFRVIYPIWRMDTTQLAHRFLDLGFRAIVCCVDAGRLDDSFVGRELNEQFLYDLPATADPCGENGEFHTFVFAGPLFREAINVKAGEAVLLNGHYYCNLTLETPGVAGAKSVPVD